jgi:hypothetical protein
MYQHNGSGFKQKEKPWGRTKESLIVNEQSVVQPLTAHGSLDLKTSAFKFK